MFETAELGHTIAKAVFNRAVPKLRADLLDAQYRLKENGTFPVIILISGVRGAGKGETVNLLNEWMDPRHILTRAFDTPSDEERARPPMWRYWRTLPPKGKIGILFGSWYTAPIIDRVFRNPGRGDLLQSIEEINRFEKMLTDEGALILKFWFHLSKEVQRRQLKALRSNPETRWRVTNATGTSSGGTTASTGSQGKRYARPAPRTRRGSWSRARTRRFGPSRSARHCSGR